MFKKYFLSGLLLWLPLSLTWMFMRFLIEMLDGSLNFLPKHYRPEVWIGMRVPGLGLILAIVVILLTGMLVSNYLGQRLIRLWEMLLRRIPIVRSIYTAVKQIAETLLMSNAQQSFRKVLLIEYPRKGLWTLAFQTGVVEGIFDSADVRRVWVYVPTTPNPTSGFVLMVSVDEIQELPISVEDALKMVLSLGLVQPGTQVKEVEHAAS